jgi:hypothetical protein
MKTFPEYIEEVGSDFVDFDVPGPNGLSLTWEWIGEGESGDFDPADPNDVARLRASLYYNGEQVDDGSYCTFATLETPKDELVKSAQDIMRQVSIDSKGQLRSRRVMEDWTWTEYSK